MQIPSYSSLIWQLQILFVIIQTAYELAAVHIACGSLMKYLGEIQYHSSLVFKTLGQNVTPTHQSNKVRRDGLAVT